jgi:hypothetical protein
VRIVMADAVRHDRSWWPYAPDGTHHRTGSDGGRGVMGVADDVAVRHGRYRGRAALHGPERARANQVTRILELGLEVAGSFVPRFTVR